VARARSREPVGHAARLAAARGEPRRSLRRHVPARARLETSDGVYWDGAVIEISKDGGATWQDITAYADPGYGGTIGDPDPDGASNVLRGRSGYVAQNPSYPALDEVTIDMGTQLAGQTVEVRFRVATDDATGDIGWTLDDIGFSGITNAPFAALVDDPGACTSTPIADAGPDQTVASGEPVSLDGSNSEDPQNEPLTFAWTQTAGPATTLTGADTATPTFTAPDVAGPTTATFELVVSDGKGSATDTVDVLIEPSTTGAGAGGESAATAGAGGDAGAGGGSVVRSGAGQDDGGCGCVVAGDEPLGGGERLAASLIGVAALLIRRRRRSR
jgi:MYXO-CTERM domain-containing protein